MLNKFVDDRTNYRKYGVIQFVKADDTKRLDKKEPKKKVGFGLWNGTDSLE